jgi:DNA-binding winged helix-turn-helix (wHTH) protein
MAQSSRCYRFGVFEADAATGELRRQGVRVKLNAQSFQVLVMLLERPGQLLTREEIARELWPGDTFVDYEHGLNSAVNRIREALGDTAGNSRFVETLPRRGYRFISPVSTCGAADAPSEPVAAGLDAAGADGPESDPGLLGRFLATAEDLPQTSTRVVETLFVLLQLMYVAFYVGALANLTEIGDLLSPLPHAAVVMMVLIGTAAISIPLRAFLVSAVVFRAPKVRRQVLTLWPLVLVLDLLWALSPFLLLHHINYGLALACTALLVYSPFAQRSLVLMGAGRAVAGSR